jgi:hypothetical protein
MAEQKESAGRIIKKRQKKQGTEGQKVVGPIGKGRVTGLIKRRGGGGGGAGVGYKIQTRGTTAAPRKHPK